MTRPVSQSLDRENGNAVDREGIDLIFPVVDRGKNLEERSEASTWIWNDFKAKEMSSDRIRIAETREKLRQRDSVYEIFI